MHRLDLEIWFIRHAESEANVKRIYANTGHSFPLTTNGLEQARAMSGPFSALEVCAVYTSPLLRAIQTAEEICRLNKIGIRIAPELSEYNMGIYEGTSSLPDTPGAISDAESKRRWFEQNDFDARSPGGESLRDMKCRFLAFIARTIEIHVGTPGIILMITHGGILNAVLPFVFENLDPAFVRARSIPHLGIVKGKPENGRLICLEYDGNSVAGFGQ
jgi:2,3-bisphosphoglycerate-dependent phosphoglycerate mutase